MFALVRNLIVYCKQLTENRTLLDKKTRKTIIFTVMKLKEILQYNAEYDSSPIFD